MLPEFPEVLRETGKAEMRRVPASNPGRASLIAVLAVAVMLVAGVLLANMLLVRPLNVLVQGVKTVYYVTPQGGPPPLSTPQVNPGGPAILSAPTPPFFLAGDVYRNNDVYRADTGAPVRQYLKTLGAVTTYAPKLVNGILYMPVRTEADQGIGKMVMYALRASGGEVLWKWDNCGESVNMSAPVITNGTVYFVCQVTASLYRLYALRASSGTKLWLDTLPGEVSLDLIGDQQALYIQLDNQILAESAATGRLLWQQSFGTSDHYIDQMALGQGILYMFQARTFYALKTRTGEKLWEYRFIGDYNYFQTIVAQNTLYLFADEMSRPTSIYALDSITGVLRWQKQLNTHNNGSPVIDQGNLYLVFNVFASAQSSYAPPLKRALLAIQGSSGRTLWQQDIPWNKGKLNYAMIEPPELAAGAGRIYLVDWKQSADSPSNLPVIMGAFSENSGALLWTRDITSPWS